MTSTPLGHLFDCARSKLYLGAISLLFLIGCDQRKADQENKSINHSSNQSNTQEASNSNKLNDILNKISLHEYLEREHGKGIFTPSQLQHLKDSINYDSLRAINLRKLPVVK